MLCFDMILFRVLIPVETILNQEAILESHPDKSVSHSFQQSNVIAFQWETTFIYSSLEDILIWFTWHIAENS